MFDLVLEGGRVVTAGMDGLADIGIKDGRIAALGTGLSGPRINVEGKLILPGGLDMHVHLTEYPLPENERAGYPPGTTEIRWVDDFESGTRAAAAGGVTTVGNMSYARENEGLLEMLDRTARAASSTSFVDFVLHGVVTHPDAKTLADIASMPAQGHTSIKFFLSKGHFEHRIPDFVNVLRVAGEHGVLPMAHCEDAGICHHLSAHLTAQGKTSAEYYPASRPDYSEESAITRAIALAHAADSPLYIVHVSTLDGVLAIDRARMRGWPVFAETRPLYLYQSDDVHTRPDAAKYVGRPPVRSPRDVDGMWDAMASRVIDTYCTDHAPYLLADKLAPDLNVANAFKAGHADLDTALPQLFDATVHKRGWSVQRFVELTATNAARIFGLFPRKGTIAIGADADLVVWDPQVTKTIDSQTTQSRSDFSLYDGQTVTGWPVMTIVRGNIVFQSGKIEGAAGYGSLAHRNSASRTAAF
ncbi:amidohydrolase family protein [Mycolicibacterium goodii]|uniref:Amidohydrolase family protein n=1 Tax=Mycolicibacterium goodii TaxID=134601 RepID=A0ABS6HYG5_MYCGD|nr:amidohydrolase family protein [Mycolicibacterium goodii]MBU8827698.1 amidohydrolase family protein [Mycolicibacterium goodii]MBU8841481.1 amidohydrolase family protein [Mycolicibacterium goodii]